MKTLGLLLLVQICCIAVEGFPLKSATTRPARPNVKRPVPKYVLELFNENVKQGRGVNILHCVFPQIIRTKRAIKIIFMNNTLKDYEISRRKRDELRIFMTTAKKAIASSGKPYFVKIFDLRSGRLVNIFKFSTKDYGWKTINVTDWRKVKPGEDERGSYGLKIVVMLGKKKLTIDNTAFRKSKTKHEPYFIEFFHEKKQKTQTTKPKGTGLFPSDRYGSYNFVPSKYDLPKWAYYPSFSKT